MAHIDYYFSTTSPYAYLASNRLEAVAAKHGATITYKPLNTAMLFTRTGGKAPKDRHPARLAYRLVEMRRQAAQQGMDIHLEPAHWPTNPAPSSYAIIAAQKAGGGDLGALVHGVLRSVWAEQKDVAEEAVVADALEAAGFDRNLVNAGLLQGAEEYASNLEEAVSRNVFGVPFYLVGDEPFWGQDRIADLDHYLGTL
jgi:2-hydroxychromene-2-carboxylate isomerase